MRMMDNVFKEMLAEVPAEINAEMDLSFAIATRLDALIKEKGLSKRNLQKQLANALARLQNGSVDNIISH